MAKHPATRKQARRRAKAKGPGFKIKTASRLTKSQKKRQVGQPFAKLNKSGQVKLIRVKGRELVPQFVIIAPKVKKRKTKISVPSL